MSRDSVDDDTPPDGGAPPPDTAPGCSVACFAAPGVSPDCVTFPDCDWSGVTFPDCDWSGVLDGSSAANAGSKPNSTATPVVVNRRYMGNLLQFLGRNRRWFRLLGKINLFDSAWFP